MRDFKLLVRDARQAAEMNAYYYRARSRKAVWKIVATLALALCVTCIISTIIACGGHPSVLLMVATVWAGVGPSMMAWDRQARDFLSFERRWQKMIEAWRWVEVDPQESVAKVLLHRANRLQLEDHHPTDRAEMERARVRAFLQARS